MSLRPMTRKHLEAWEHFLQLLDKYNVPSPTFPIWAMEFGATYDYKGIAPYYQQNKLKEIQKMTIFNVYLYTHKPTNLKIANFQIGKNCLSSRIVSSMLIIKNGLMNGFMRFANQVSRTVIRNLSGIVAQNQIVLERSTIKLFNLGLLVFG